VKMRAGFILALIVFGLSACAQPEVEAPAVTRLSPADANEECYCNVRKRQQVEARLQKKKQLETE